MVQIPLINIKLPLFEVQSRHHLIYLVIYDYMQIEEEKPNKHILSLERKTIKN